MKRLFTALLLLAGPLLAAGHTIPSDAASIAAGKKLYLQKCASCHGLRGDGAGPAADTLDPKPRDYTSEKLQYGSTDEQLFTTVWNGSPNQASMMRGFKGQLKEAQVLQILAYVKAQFLARNPTYKR